MGRKLSLEERNRAAKLIGQGYSAREVAASMGVSPKTITGKTAKRTYVPGKLRRAPRR